MTIKVLWLAIKLLLITSPAVLAAVEKISDQEIGQDYFRLAIGGSITGGGIATGAEIYYKIPKRLKAVEGRVEENSKDIELSKQADNHIKEIMERVEKRVDKIDGLLDEALK